MSSSEYSRNIFEAYIATPAKFEWYQRAFEYFDANGGKIGWYWSSWAMVGSFWFFLYRKQMKAALILLFALLVLGAILPMNLFVYIFVFLTLGILTGGFGTYFIYRQYMDKRQELESILPDESKRILVMRNQIGGVNPIVIPMAIVMVVSFVLIVVGLMATASRGLG